MLRTDSPWLSFTCTGLWFVQLGIMVLVFHGFGSMQDETLKWWEMAAVGASVLLGLLLVQLPKPFQWRSRVGVRPSEQISAERQRIARDLHDNLGSHLVYAMALIETQSRNGREALSILEQCLLDMRLIVDTMNSLDEPFADRLARLRHRVQPVLERRSIVMLWDVQTPIEAKPLHLQGVTQLISIAQEALSNVLQHSKASQVVLCVRYVPQSNAWSMEVRDNGLGRPAKQEPGNVHTGYGTMSMHQRAALAGGLLRVERMRKGGTRVWVVVPATTEMA